MLPFEASLGHSRCSKVRTEEVEVAHTRFTPVVPFTPGSGSALLVTLKKREAGLHSPQAMSSLAMSAIGKVAVLGSWGMRMQVPFPWVEVSLCLERSRDGPIDYLVMAIDEES